MIEQLRAELARVDLPGHARQKLRGLQAVLENDPQARLQSFSMPGDEPRAVVSFGDARTADLIVYLTHGVDTGLAQFPAWADASQRLCADVIRFCIARGMPRDVAVVAWFAWDSGNHATARSTRQAVSAAAQLAGELDRASQRNPTAQIALVTYSYSSTVLGEMFALNLAGAVRTAFSLASAGVTHAAGAAIGEAIARGEVTVYAAESSPDAIAPLGRLGQHPVDPRDIPGVVVFDCDGGPAPSADGGSIRGLPVDGHASQTFTDEHGRQRIGYFDGRSQCFRTLVSLLADAATAGR